MAHILMPGHISWLPHPAARLSAEHRSWLFRPGALTEGLRTLGAFQLRVVDEYADRLGRVEARVMRQRPGTVMWVREVVMSIDGVDCVSARSMTPLRASHGPWSAMRRLRNRPLADILYGTREVTRGAFTWRQIGIGDALWQAVRRATPVQTESMQGVAYRAKCAPRLLARQSVFWRQSEPLLVQECFLPGFWDRLSRRRQGA